MIHTRALEVESATNMGYFTAICDIAGGYYVLSLIMYSEPGSGGFEGHGGQMGSKRQSQLYAASGS